MPAVTRLPTSLRSACVTVTAFWLAVVGTGASLVHSHGDAPGESSPHRHLILFGLECPAELPADGDGSDLWQSAVDPPADIADAVGAPPVSLFCDPTPAVTFAPAGAADCFRTLRPGHVPSPRAIRCAILRA